MIFAALAWWRRRRLEGGSKSQDGSARSVDVELEVVVAAEVPLLELFPQDRGPLADGRAHDEVRIHDARRHLEALVPVVVVVAPEKRRRDASERRRRVF